MSGISKTERSDINEKGVKFLNIPFLNIRTSALYYHFLPAFYLFLILTIGIYGFYFGLSINNFYLSKYLSFLQNYRYEILLFMLPLLYITFKLSGIIINSFGGTLIGITKRQDQIISKDTYDLVGRNDEVIKHLNDFYKFKRKLEEKDLVSGPVYWHIFHYVMDYYYAQENVYDDLRQAIFIRNIIAANIILKIVLFFVGLSLHENIITLVYIVFLGFMSFFLYKMYISGLRKYHLKLILTFIYIYTNVTNIKKIK